jgi:hypothetical protein
MLADFSRLRRDSTRRRIILLRKAVDLISHERPEANGASNPILRQFCRRSRRAMNALTQNDGILRRQIKVLRLPPGPLSFAELGITAIRPRCDFLLSGHGTSRKSTETASAAPLRSLRSSLRFRLQDEHGNYQHDRQQRPDY